MFIAGCVLGIVGILLGLFSFVCLAVLNDCNDCNDSKGKEPSTALFNAIMIGPAAFMLYRILGILALIMIAISTILFVLSQWGIS